ncbi:MAG: hypothetical protein ACKO0Z_10550 [Betaproteobacteria bacterium]
MPLGWVAGATLAAGVYSANKASSAQSRATDAASQAAADQTALSRDQFDWNKQIYQSDIAPMQRQQNELQTRIAEDALARAQKQDALADEQNQYYKDTFQPVERKVVSDAMNYDSADNIARRSGIAAANVNQQFSNARNQSARLAGRYGLTSTAMSGPAGASERAQALGSAGAETGAAFDTMDKAIQLRAGAANFGRNMTNTALAGWGGANGSSGVAGGAANSGLAGTITGANFMNNAYNTRFSNIGSTNGLFQNAMNNSANYWGNQASGLGQFGGGMFQKSGGLSGLQASFSNTDIGSSGFGSGMAYGNQDLGQYL